MPTSTYLQDLYKHLEKETASIPQDLSMFQIEDLERAHGKFIRALRLSYIRNSSLSAIDTSNVAGSNDKEMISSMLDNPCWTPLVRAQWEARIWEFVPSSSHIEFFTQLGSRGWQDIKTPLYLWELIEERLDNPSNPRTPMQVGINAAHILGANIPPVDRASGVRRIVQPTTASTDPDMLVRLRLAVELSEYWTDITDEVAMEYLSIIKAPEIFLSSLPMFFPEPLTEAILRVLPQEDILLIHPEIFTTFLNFILTLPSRSSPASRAKYLIGALRSDTRCATVEAMISRKTPTPVTDANIKLLIADISKPQIAKMLSLAGSGLRKMLVWNLSDSTNIEHNEQPCPA